MASYRSNVLLATVLSALGASLLGAQTVGVSLHGIGISADHELLGSPLIGAAVALRVSQHDGPLSARIGLERLRGHANHIGVPCAGLVMPGTCAPEAVRDDGQLTGVRVGAAMRMLRWRRIAVELNADLGLSAISANTRGLVSAREIDATKHHWGWLFGAEARWSPVARIPLAVEVGVGLGGFAPVNSELVLDGYTPFERGFTARGARAGIAWAP